MVMEEEEEITVNWMCAGYWSGNTSLHEELEQAIANFVGKPAAMLIGAIGKTGRGSCKLKGVDPADDVMMGTFTKSLDLVVVTLLPLRQDLVKYLRSTSPAHIYATALSPPSVQQVIYELKVILGEDNND
ncbi:unnamed protein product [Sphagnum troendelagicum]